MDAEWCWHCHQVLPAHDEAGHPIVRGRRRFCDDTCRRRYYQGNARVARVTACEHCGAELPDVGRHTNRRFCGRVCREQHLRALHQVSCLSDVVDLSVEAIERIFHQALADLKARRTHRVDPWRQRSDFRSPFKE